jgi:hypothetical protein
MMISNSSFGQASQTFFSATNHSESPSQQRSGIGESSNGKLFTSSTTIADEDDGDSSSGMDIDCHTTNNTADFSVRDENKSRLTSNDFTQEIQSHTKTVQALRKYLQRKLSTEGRAEFESK